MQGSWILNEVNANEEIYSTGNFQRQNNWKRSFSVFEERRDSFDGFNLEYELHRISEAYQIKDLQILNGENNLLTSNHNLLNYQKLVKSKEDNASQILIPIFKIIYPPIFREMINQNFKSNRTRVDLRANSEDTQSHISPSKDSFKVWPSLYVEPISEVIRRINDGYPKNHEKMKKRKHSNINTGHSKVFRIDDRLCFINYKEKACSKNKAKSTFIKEKSVIKKDERQVSERNVEHYFEEKSIFDIKLNGNKYPKVSKQIKKNIKKKTKFPIHKKKWGYIKNDFIYYGPNKHNTSEISSKDNFMIKIPLCFSKL